MTEILFLFVSHCIELPQVNEFSLLSDERTASHRDCEAMPENGIATELNTPLLDEPVTDFLGLELFLVFPRRLFLNFLFKEILMRD